MSETCVRCVHFKRFAGFRLENPFTVGDGYAAGRTYTSMGLGHCEHQTQPRGLVAAAYVCPNFESNQRMVDVTPKPVAIGSGQVT